MSDEHSVNPLIILVVGLIVGVVLSQAYTYTYKIKLSEDVVFDIEDKIREFPRGWYEPILREDLTLSEARDYYFRYGNVSRTMMRLMVEDMCGVRP